MFILKYCYIDIIKNYAYINSKSFYTNNCINIYRKRYLQYANIVTTYFVVCCWNFNMKTRVYI